ncbi:MAG: universal stress protein [Nitrospirae bacterium]|nr:universal stress protein [Nitrospirota bacterium]
MIAMRGAKGKSAEEQKCNSTEGLKNFCTIALLHFCTFRAKVLPMGRYRKILAAVDGSDSSKNAFRQACKIVHDDKSWITVLTTIPVYQDQFDVLSTREKIGKKLQEEGEKILAGIREIANEEDVYIRTKIEEGTPFQTIVDAADEGGYDLIVMGRHGMKRLEKTLVGSVTARVIGHSQSDVLVVPHDSAIGWKEILLPTDGSKYCRAAAEKAIDLAKSYGGQLRIVSIVDVTDEFQTEAPGAVEKLVKEAKGFVEGVKRNAEAEGVKAEALVKEGETYKIITDTARQYNSNVIVMGSHGRTGIKRLLMGSVAEKVIGYAPCPVLVVKP